MSEELKPCSYRQVDEGGRILCGLIKSGDREVSINLCRACPVPQINCQHLRATMQKQIPNPITVRFATGRVEVWNGDAPTISFQRAACAEKTMQINSPRDCVGCPLQMPVVVPQSAMQIARHKKIASQPIVQTESRATMATEVPVQSLETSALIQRAQTLAANKTRLAKRESVATTYTSNPAQGVNKSKVILLQQWLAAQLNKNSANEASSDNNGVQEIVYAPIAPTHQEEPEYERCVGWTD